MLSKLIEAVEKERENLIDFTRAVARIPSVTGDEMAISETFAEHMESLGIETQRSKVSETQSNVLGWIRGSGEGKSLMLTGHVDTVACADGWTKDPYGGELEDGKIYGNGVSNMKASDTAMLYAVHAIRNSGVQLKGDLLIALVVSECASGIGTLDLMDKGIKADRFINGEPTDLGVLTLHSGPQYIKVSILGRTGHAGSHDSGLNAAQKMLELVAQLGPMNEQIPAGGWLTFDADARYQGLPRYHLGSLRAGLGREFREAPSNTPDFCTAVLNVRAAPNHNVESTEQDIQSLLKDMQKTEPGFEFETTAETGKPAFESPPDSAAARAVVTAYAEVERTDPVVGGIQPYLYIGSDAGFMQAAGMRDGVVIGPGSLTASVADEHVEVEKLVAASKIYAAAALELCGFTA